MRTVIHNVGRVGKALQIDKPRAPLASSSKHGHYSSRKRTERVKDAMKAASKRAAAMRRKRPQIFRVYVGNIHPRTTVTQLLTLFEGCEGLYEIVLRSGHGSVMKAEADTPVTRLDMQYATVELTQWKGLVKAHGMNGIVSGGRRLVVGLSAAVLPEFDRIMYEHEHGEGSSVRDKLGTGTLAYEPTVIIGRPSNRDVIAWHGYCFSKSVV